MGNMSYFKIFTALSYSREVLQHYNPNPKQPPYISINIETGRNTMENQTTPYFPCILKKDQSCNKLSNILVSNHDLISFKTDRKSTKQKINHTRKPQQAKVNM